MGTVEAPSSHRGHHGSSSPCHCAPEFATGDRKWDSIKKKDQPKRIGVNRTGAIVHVIALLARRGSPMNVKKELQAITRKHLRGETRSWGSLIVRFRLLKVRARAADRSWSSLARDARGSLPRRACIALLFPRSAMSAASIWWLDKIRWHKIRSRFHGNSR